MNRRAGEGTLSTLPRRRIAWLASAVLGWLALQTVLLAWWATVIVRQARRIAALEAQQGVSGQAALAQWSSTRRMLVGESSTFVALLLAVSLLLAWLYWREHRRARSMQAFFASVTHELRTPLTSIRLQAEAIAEDAAPGGTAVLARRLLEDSHRLESQVDKTLELARIEGGGPLSEQAVPLQPWLARVLGELTAVHGEALDISARIDDGLPPVQADAGALQMILRNLIENSIRHAQLSPVGVRLSAAQRGTRVVLEYRDNGRGVAAGSGRLGRLFGRGPGSSGAGVGLYLVRRLMQRMGGSVRFDSAPGAGFRCELSFRASS